jgi:hypothetical protein
MDTDYDRIAEQYKRARLQPWRMHIERYWGGGDDGGETEGPCGGVQSLARPARLQGATAAAGSSEDRA